MWSCHKQAEVENYITLLHVKIWCNDRLSCVDHRADAEKRVEDQTHLIVFLVTSLSLILYNLWIETEINV